MLKNLVKTTQALKIKIKVKLFAVQYKSAHDGNLAAAQPRKTINPLSLYRIKKQQPTRSQTQRFDFFYEEAMLILIICNFIFKRLFLSILLHL